MKLQRYELWIGTTDGEMTENPDGTYVLYTDTEALEKSHAELLAAASHLGSCDFPEEIEHRCERCVSARETIQNAEKIEIHGLQ